MLYNFVMTKRKENPLPKGFSATLRCQFCASTFYGSVATRYCGDQCHIRARSIETASGCWEWQGKKNKNTGRGQINPSKGVHTSAARVAYAAFVAPIPGKMLVCHRCDNPGCVNPNHLFVGSNDDNMADMVSKGRQVHGERSPFAKLTPDTVRAIRASQEPTGDIAKRMGLNWKTVSAARSGKTWRHVA